MVSDRFVFFSRSRDAPPGKGVGESLAGDPRRYAALNTVPHWRRLLSNFHEAPFDFDGKTYRTIEHGFQAAKIALADPAAAAQFAMESGSELSRGDGAAAQRQRKMVQLSPEQLAVWDAMKDDTLAALAEAKYNACHYSREVLRLTGDAELWHQVSRSRPVRFSHLERIRDAHRM